MASTRHEEDRSSQDMRSSPPTSRWEVLNHDQCPVPEGMTTHLQQETIQYLLDNATTTLMDKVVTTTRHDVDAIAIHNKEGSISHRKPHRSIGTTKATREGHVRTTHGIKADPSKLETSKSGEPPHDHRIGKDDNLLNDLHPAVPRLFGMWQRKQITH
jgi:hypothetical protein